MTTTLQAVNRKRNNRPFSRIFAIACAAVLSLQSASAQTTTIAAPAANYSGEMVILTPQNEAVTAKIFAIPTVQRLELQTEQGVIVSILDREKREAYSYGKDANGPMGIHALKLDFDKAAQSLAANLHQDPSSRLTGTDIVAGQVCNTYIIENSLACVTRDGIMLRATSKDGGKIEMTSFTRASQPPYLFRVPNGYIIGETSAIMGSISPGDEGRETGLNMQSFLENQAHKHTKKQIKNMAKKQIGDNIGGAIGGGLVGGTIGNEAGKLAKGLVGGLFGKKKKKKQPELELKTSSKPKQDGSE